MRKEREAHEREKQSMLELAQSKFQAEQEEQQKMQQQASGSGAPGGSANLDEDAKEEYLCLLKKILKFCEFILLENPIHLLPVIGIMVRRS